MDRIESSTDMVPPERNVALDLQQFICHFKLQQKSLQVLVHTCKSIYLMENKYIKSNKSEINHADQLMTVCPIHFVAILQHC